MLWQRMKENFPVQKASHLRIAEMLSLTYFAQSTIGIYLHTGIQLFVEINKYFCATQN